MTAEPLAGQIAKAAHDGEVFYAYVVMDDGGASVATLVTNPGGTNYRLHQRVLVERRDIMFTSTPLTDLDGIIDECLAKEEQS